MEYQSVKTNEQIVNSPNYPSAVAIGHCPGNGDEINLMQVFTMAQTRPQRQSIDAALEQVGTEWQFENKQFTPRISAIAERLHEHWSMIGNLNSDTDIRSTSVGISAAWKGPIGTIIDLRQSLQRGTQNITNSPTTMFQGPATTLSVTQPLLKGAGWKVGTANMASSNRKWQTAKLQYEIDTSADAISVIGLYLDAISAKRRVLVAKDALDTALKMLQAISQSVASGIRAPSDLRQASYDVSQRKADLSAAQAAAKITLLNLAPIIGCTSASWRLGDFRFSENKILEQMPKLRVDELAEMRIAYLALDEANQNVELAENGKLPDFSIIWSKSTSPVARTVTSVAPSFLNGNRIDFKLTVPLNDYESKKVLDIARSKQIQAKYNVEQVRADLVVKLEAGRLAIDDANSQLILSRNQFKNAEQVLLDEQEKLRLGRSSLFEMQSAQTARVVSKLAADNAEINFYKAKLAFWQKIGRLSEILPLFVADGKTL